MTILSFGKIIVWPKLPQPTAGVKLHDQPIKGNPDPHNVVVMPVVRIERIAKPAPSYNDIQKIVAKTMRSQRYTKRSTYAAEKLRKMFLNPG